MRGGSRKFCYGTACSIGPWWCSRACSRLASRSITVSTNSCASKSLLCCSLCMSATVGESSSGTWRVNTTPPISAAGRRLLRGPFEFLRAHRVHHGAHVVGRGYGGASRPPWRRVEQDGTDRQHTSRTGRRRLFYGAAPAGRAQRARCSQVKKGRTVSGGPAMGGREEPGFVAWPARWPRRRRGEDIQVAPQGHGGELQKRLP